MPDDRSIDNAAESELARHDANEMMKAAARTAARRILRTRERQQPDIQPQQMFALAGGFGLLALLLITIFNQDPESDAVIVPVFPLAALLFFLYPFRREIVARRTMQLGIATFVIWLSIALSGVLAPFIIAFVLAYICAPFVKHFAAHGIPRWVTSLAIVVLILATYVVIGVFVIPSLVDEFNQLWASAQNLLKDANSYLDTNRMVQRLTRYGIPKAQAHDLVVNQLQPQLQELAKWLIGSILQMVRNASSILEGVFNLIAIPILAFYLMLDFDRLRTFIRGTLLRDNADYVYFVKRIDTILNAYLRGILTTSSIVAVLATSILVVFDVPYAVAIGILTGVFNLIPTLGMFMNLGVAMVIYLFAPGSFWVNTGITTGMIAFLHALNTYFIEPRVIGGNVGLHPVLMIASLFIFGYFLGFIGLVIAVPTTAVIMMFFKEWYLRSVTLKGPEVAANQ